MSGKRWRRMLRLGMLLLAAVVGILVWNGYAMYARALKGEPLAEKVADVQSQKDYVRTEALPKGYLDAVVAAEDHRFRQHFGVDVIAIARATWHNISSMSLKEGGSTITQQLAKNLYFTQEKRFVRKIAEVFLALKLEQSYTKEEILELYVNTIYFGDGYTGVGEASAGYFGKAPKDLTDAECTMLAGLPNAPSVYAGDPELAKERQDYVVRQMVKYGYLTEQQGKTILGSR